MVEQKEFGEVDLELQNYINILWRRKFTILLTLIATLATVVIGTKRIAPVYQASTTLRIAVSASGEISYSDYMYADRLMNTYVNIATSRPMTNELIKQLNLSQSPSIEAEIIPNTELIKITVEDTDPLMAAKIANTLADILIEQSNKLFMGGGKSLTDVLGQQLAIIKDDLDETQQEYEALIVQTPTAPDSIDATRQMLQIKQNNYASLLGQYEQARFREEIQASMFTVLQTADVPWAPSKPNILLNVALGFLVGLVGGLGLAFLFENLDTTLYEVDDIETITKLPALARIPKANKTQINTFQEGFSPFTETFRNLATNLQVINPNQGKKVLLMMSAEPTQGKSMITFHLACSLAELGKEVVAVDCDTRLPSLHNFFQLPNQNGLKDVLEQKVSLEDALQKSSFEGVHVLTSGSPLAHPSQMLSSVQMTKLVKSLSQQFDYVLLDSPAMLAVADVAALTPNANGLILVVRQAHAQRDAIQATSNYLAGQNGKSAFLVINQVNNASHRYYQQREKAGSLLDLLKRIWNYYHKQGKKAGSLFKKIWVKKGI